MTDPERQTAAGLEERPQGSGLVAAMCVGQLLMGAGVGTYPALLPEIASGWDWSAMEAGLVGGVLFLGYVLATPHLSALTDRVDARRVYAGSSVVAAAGLLLFALVADGLAGALLAQALFGAGFAGMYMPGLKALADRVPEENRSRASAIYSSVQGAGMALSYALAPVLAASVGWRWAFAASAGCAAAAGIIATNALAARRPSPAAVRLSLVESFRRVRANQLAIGYVIAYAAHCWELFAFRAWLVAFLGFAAHRTAAGPAAEASLGTIAGAVALAGIAWSILCNELAARLGRVRLLFGILGAGLAANMLLSLSWQVSFLAATVATCLYYLNANSDAGALNAGVVEASVPSERGATLAVYSTAGYVAGFLGPAAAGLVLDLAGGVGSGAAWMAALAVIAAPGLLAMGALRRFTGAENGVEGVAAPAGGVKR